MFLFLFTYDFINDKFNDFWLINTRDSFRHKAKLLILLPLLVISKNVIRILFITLQFVFTYKFYFYLALEDLPEPSTEVLLLKAYIFLAYPHF